MPKNKTAPFTVEGENVWLSGTECAQCQHRWFPALDFGCEKCGAYGEDLIPVKLSGAGQILSFTTVPEADGGVFTLAQLALADGPAIRGIIIEPAAEELSIGDRVEAMVVGETEDLRVCFRRVSA